MKTFREIVQESFIYTISDNELTQILKDSNYKRMSKGGRFEKEKLFGDGEKVIISYNEEYSKLIIHSTTLRIEDLKGGF